MASGRQWKAFRNTRQLTVQRKRARTTDRVPDSEERVLPLVGHRENVLDMHVLPVLISNVLSLGRWRRLSRVSFDPFLLDEHVELFRPTNRNRQFRRGRAESRGRLTKAYQTKPVA